MRKYFLITILVIMAVLFCKIIFWGVVIGNYKIHSYSEIELENAEKNNLLSELNYKNTVEFNAKKEILNYAVQDYNEKKSQYYKLIEDGKITENKEDSMDLYDIDFLMTIIGNHATEKNVTLQFDIIKNSNTLTNSSEYVMCDLNFTITGNYMDIINFIYSIEDDDRLSFEINNFFMEKGGENLQATFVVKKVPLNRKNLSLVPTIVSGSSSENFEN